MGWFLGHLLPGLAWLSMGFFHLSQSLHTVPITNPLRRRSFWIAFRCLMVFIFACAAITIESIDESANWGASNIQHMIMWSGLGFSAILEYCQIINYLTDPLFSIIPALGMQYISIMLVLHAQKVVFWSYLHIYSGAVVFPLFFLFVSIQHTRYRALIKKNLLTDRPPGSFIWIRNKFEDLNPLYTEEAPYDTVAPGLAAFVIIFEAITWLEMASQMGPYNADNLPSDPPNPLLSLADCAVKNFLATCVVCWLMSSILKNLSLRSGLSMDDTHV